MGSIGRYIFRTTMGAFTVVLVSLTALIWMTQALRDVDLMTSQGQSILVFMGITSLIIPLLLLVIAPLALVIAVSHVLNKLSSDSELIVMNAAGMSPFRLLRAFIPVVALVSIFVAVLGVYLAPLGLQSLRSWLTQVRADLVTYIAQPGRFTSIERGLTFHVRERRPNGLLLGILVDDQRDPKERSTILANQGSIIKNSDGTFLVLENGTVQRQQQGEHDTTIVAFERYAFDLSRFSSGGVVRFSVRERYLWDLIWPDREDPVYKQQPQQFINELLDRLAAPIYPIAFVIVAYAFLGAPRTTRQSREFSVASAITAIAVIRIIGLSCSVIGARQPLAQLGQYGTLLGASVLGLRTIYIGDVIEPPAFVSNTVAAITARFARRAMAT